MMKFFHNDRSNTFSAHLVLFGFCVILALLLMLIATKSSPLYPFNDWVDTNASFTVGKAMMNGRVLYRDIFDQRGPFLYFLYGLAYLISEKSFLGVFIVEVLLFSVFLFYVYKLFSLYFSKSYAIIVLPIFTAVVLNLESFDKGGSPEEFCVPLILISFYHLNVYFKEIYPKPFPNRWVFYNGIIAGCVLWVKFSLLGFWFGWMVAIIISMIMEKEYSRVIRSSIVLLSGMLIATLPWLIYFGIHQSISDWINAYFVINLTSYSETSSLISIFRSSLIGMLYPLYENPFLFGFIIFGIITYVIFNKTITNKFHKILLVLSFLFLTLSVFAGGRMYRYYYLIFSPIIIFGFITFLTMINNKFGELRSFGIILLITILSLAASFSYTFVFNRNSYMLKLDDEELVQIKFARIIDQTEDATLLNYGVLDLGFYTTTGITPNVRFFQSQNIPELKFPLVMHEQNRYIKEGVVDYVVTVKSVGKSLENIENPYLFHNYRLIQEEIQTYEGKDYDYLLFKKK